MDPVRFRKSQYFLLPESFQNLPNISLHCCQLNVVTTVKLKLFKLYYRSLVLYLYWNVSSLQSRPTLCIYSGKHGTPFMATSVTWGLFKLRLR